MNQTYTPQSQQELYRQQREARLSKIGYKPTPGVITEQIDGTRHDPRVRQTFSDVLIGGKYKGMFQKEVQRKDEKHKLEKLSGVVNTGTEMFTQMESMLDPDKGYRPTSQQSFNGGAQKLDINSIQGADFDDLLRKRIEQKNYRVQQEQQPRHTLQKSGGLSYSEFASDKETFAPEIAPIADASPEQRQDYKAYQNYMYQMNEGIIREIAQDIAEQTIKSVLTEHIKSERKKYVFERVEGKNPKTGKKFELLKKDDKYYTLQPITTESGTFVALQEVSVKTKKKK